MRPVAPVHEVLIIHMGRPNIYRHAESLWSNARSNPYQTVTLFNGLLKYRMNFAKDGRLTHWERYTYLNMMGATRGNVANKYHKITVLDGTYSAQIVEAFTLGIKVEKPVDMETPEDV